MGYLIETILVLFITGVMGLALSYCLGTLRQPRDHGNLTAKKRRTKL